MAVTPDEVSGRQDLVAFLAQFSRQLQSSPESVPNATLAGFLAGA
jgi:hypothetical protein